MSDADRAAVHLPVAGVPGGVALRHALVDLGRDVVDEVVRARTLALVAREVRRVVARGRQGGGEVHHDAVDRASARASCGQSRTA